MFDNAQVVEVLLTANADPNAADKVRCSRTTLHFVLSMG
jgi:hypothetical protein